MLNLIKAEQGRRQGGGRGDTPWKHLVGKIKDFVGDFYIGHLIKFDLFPPPVDTYLR